MKDRSPITFICHADYGVPEGYDLVLYRQRGDVAVAAPMLARTLEKIITNPEQCRAYIELSHVTLDRIEQDFV